MFTCEPCDRTFVTGGGIANHLEALHPQDASASYKCKECGKEFDSLKGMTEHYRNKHDRTGDPAKPAVKSKVSK